MEETLILLSNILIAPSPSNHDVFTTVSKNHNSSCVFPRRRFCMAPLAAAAKRPKKKGRPREPELGATDDKDKKLVHRGVITQSLGNGMFRVRLDQSGEVVLGYICGKIRKNRIIILPGDNVSIEIGLGDTMRGRIVFRKDK